MKKIFLCLALICTILCACGKEKPLDDLTESNQNGNLENEEYRKSMIDQQIPEESSETHKETIEEYIERMKSVYLEIKEEVFTIGSEKKEIMFNEIQWGCNLISADNELQEKEGAYTVGMLNATVSISSRIGIKMELDARYTDFSTFDNIGGATRVSKKEMQVAGYSVEDCMLLFSAVEKEGKYILTDEDSALYAAQYTIKPVDCKAAKEDLKTKISSIYGEPDSTRDVEPYANADMAQEYVYWYGAKDTVLVLTADSGGTITISYVWLGGEELLNAALDNAEKSQNEKEGAVYGDGDTSGL